VCIPPTNRDNLSTVRHLRVCAGANDRVGIAAALRAMADGDGRYLLNMAEQIYTLPPEERQRWAVKLKPLEEDWVKSMDAKGLPGRQLLSDLREAIKKYDP